MKQPTNHNFSLDLVRVLAIFGVVAIHVFYPIYSRPDFAGGISWWFAYGINTLSRVAVPFFLLVSGTLMLPRRPKNETKDTLSRVVWRLSIPLIFWAIIYWRWEYIFYGRFTFLDQALMAFFSGGIFHLYFLVILIGLYLWLPLWRLFKPTRYILGLSFFLGIIIYGLQFFLYKNQPILNFFTLWVPYVGYFLAGPYLFNLKNNPTRKLLALIIFAAAAIFTAVMGYFNLRLLAQNQLIFWGAGSSEYFTHWLAPNIILLSLSGYFLLIKANFRFTGRWLQALVSSIAANAFGIYLVHLLLINYLDKYWHFFLDLGYTRLWLYGISKMAVVFLLSYLISVVGRRLPLVKAVFGEGKSRG